MNLIDSAIVQIAKNALVKNTSARELCGELERILHKPIFELPALGNAAIATVDESVVLGEKEVMAKIKNPKGDGKKKKAAAAAE